MAERAALPDASVLLANYSTLMLGQFDLAAPQTRYTRHRTELVPGVIVTIEKFQRRPAELVQKTTAWDGSTVLTLQGYDGTAAWEVSDGVARLVTGAEAELLKTTAAFYDGLLPASITTTLARGVTVGETRIDGEALFAISLPGSTLAEAEAGGLPIAYISKSTGLLASVTIGHAGGTWHVAQTFGSYRDFGGLLVATELTTTSRAEAIDFKQWITIDEIRWDSVAESEFELPDAVRALMNP